MVKKKKRKGMVSIAILFSMILIMIPMFVTALFYYVDIIMIGESFSVQETLTRNSLEILVTTLALYLCVIGIISRLFFFGKPKDTDTLASQEWATEDDLKKYFTKAPIDPFARLDIGGVPITKLNNGELLYDKDVNNDLTVGATRSGKTRKILIVLMFMCAMARESMLVNDPKKELYKMFKRYLEKIGYKVYCLDFRFLQFSDCKNPMDRVINFINEDDIDEADQAAQDLVETLVDSNSSSETIWIDGQKAMAKAAILAVAQANMDISRKNFYSVYQTIAVRGSEHSFNGDKKGKMELTAYIEYLNEDDAARTAYAPIRNAPEKTRGSFMTSTLSTLRLFGSRKLNRIINRSDFQFKDFTEKPVALFITNPDEKSTYNKIASIFYDQSYQEFVEEANKNGGQVKKRIHNIFDEAGNMSVITELDKKLTVSLGRGILYHLFIQSYAQLEKLYKSEGKKTIVDNCITKFFISSGDYETCEDISQRIGNRTIWVNSKTGSYSMDANPTGGSSQWNQQQRRLIDANELLTADYRSGKGIKLTKTYHKPAEVYLPDITEYDAFNKELDNPEVVVEKERKTDDIYYAVPRWTVITEAELRGGNTDDNRTFIMNMMGKSAADSPNQKEMYWYWSMRNDLEEKVKKHILDVIKESGYTFTREDIRNYLESSSFLNFINSVDKIQNRKTNIKNDSVTVLEEDEETVLESFFGDV